MIAGNGLKSPLESTAKLMYFKNMDAHEGEPSEVNNILPAEKKIG